MYGIDTDSWSLYPPWRGKAGRALCARLLFEALATALLGILYIIAIKDFSGPETILAGYIELGVGGEVVF